MPTGLYEDPMARYDSSRLERLNPVLQGNAYAYDMSAAQTWNVNGFGGGAHILGGIGPGAATGRMKPNARGRTGLPTVSENLIPFGRSIEVLATFIYLFIFWVSFLPLTCLGEDLA